MIKYKEGGKKINNLLALDEAGSEEMVAEIIAQVKNQSYGGITRPLHRMAFLLLDF